MWGFKVGAWWRAAVLGGGAQIPVAGPGQGATERVEFLGGFDRLFVAGTASTGIVTAQLVPYEVIR